MRNFRRACLLAFSLLVSAAVAEERATFHHRVLWLTNPATEAVLSWSTSTAGEKHSVLYDTESRGGAVENYAFQASTFKDGAFTVNEKDAGFSAPAYYHHVHLKDLKPSTTYHVVFASDDAASREFHFRTAPADDTEFTVLAGGDSRIGTATPHDHTDRQKMNQRMAQLFAEGDNVIGFVHGGDYCMTAEWRYIAPWLTDHEQTTTAAGRLLPIIPARGNHDRGIGFEEMFPFPDGSTTYHYATQLSAKVALVTLNTEISLAGDQRQWLADTLPVLRPANRWLMVSYHRPAYSSVRDVQDGAGRRNNWVPLFEEHNVDMVYESHDHALKRTLPIRAGAPDLKNGIVYIGDGGLGVPQRKVDTTRWWLQEPGFAMSAHHVHTIRFGKEEMHVRAHGMDGEILDDFVLKPREVVAAK